MLVCWKEERGGTPFSKFGKMMSCGLHVSYRTKDGMGVCYGFC